MCSVEHIILYVSYSNADLFESLCRLEDLIFLKTAKKGCKVNFVKNSHDKALQVILPLLLQNQKPISNGRI